MSENQDFRSLDELFRSTFQDLPDTPSANGWDKPSDRVWLQIEAGVKRPNNGWTTGKTLLTVAASVVVALGLYWALSSPTATTQATPQVAPPVQVPAEQAVTPSTVETVASSPAIAEAPVTVTQKNLPKSVAGERIKSKETSETPALPASGASENPPVAASKKGSAPLPGSDSAKPFNSLEKLKVELRKSWKVPLAPLPPRKYEKPVPPPFRVSIEN